MKKILLRFFTLSLLPSFCFANPNINPESFEKTTITLTRIADKRWEETGCEQPKSVRLLVVKNPFNKNGSPSPESTPDLLLQLLKRFPKMEACDIQDFLLEDMKPLLRNLVSFNDLKTLRIAGQTFDKSEMEVLGNLPLKALEFANSSLNTENAAPFPKTLEVFSYQMIPCLGQTSYNAIDATFFKQAKNLKKVVLNYPDAWTRFWVKSTNLKNSPIEELCISQPSVWEQPYPWEQPSVWEQYPILEKLSALTQFDANSFPKIYSSLGSFPTALKPDILVKHFKDLTIFSLREYDAEKLKGLFYTKKSNQWLFFGWPDLPESASDTAKGACLTQWESKLGEIQGSFPETTFRFFNMGPAITAKLQEMQQQNTWKDRISI